MIQVIKESKKGEERIAGTRRGGKKKNKTAKRKKVN